jgi:hypothetical protein
MPMPDIVERLKKDMGARRFLTDEAATEIEVLRRSLEQMTLMRDMLIAQLQSHGIDPVVHVEPKL